MVCTSTESSSSSSSELEDMEQDLNADASMSELSPNTPFLGSQTVRANPVELAVVWVEKARKGSVQWSSSCTQQQIRIYRWRKRSKLFIHCAMGLYLALALFEEPSWCIGNATPCAQEMEDMLSFDLPTMGFQVSNALEICFLLLFVWRASLRVFSLGDARHVEGWHTFGNVILCIAMTDCVVAIWNVKGIFFWNTFRVARLCRPLVFLSCYKRLRRAMERVIKSIPKYANVIVSLAVSVFLFACVALILYGHSHEGADNYGSLLSSLSSMWILFTTANNPDVWIQQYNRCRYSALVFISYLVLTLYLLNNILLAAVYDAYKGELTAEMKGKFQNRVVALGNAFDLLADERGETPQISRGQWTIFFRVFCDPNFGGVGLKVSLEEHAIETSANSLSNRLFDALDTDHSGGLDEDEFKSVVKVMHEALRMLRVLKAEKPTAASSARPLFRFVSGGTNCGGIKYNHIVDLFIMIGVIFVLASEIHSLHYHTPLYAARWVMFGFSVFYALEITFKICVIGFARFWNCGRCMQQRFDLFLVCLLLGLEVAFVFSDISLSREICLLHLSRMVRLLYYMKTMRELGDLMIFLAPTMWLLFALLMTIFYIYVTIGEQIFGGLIRKRGPLAERLAGTAFHAADYYALNFNDFSSGIVLLFVVMVLNNWSIISEAFAVVSQSMWAPAFFVSFFIVVNLIVLNILMALILDCFAAFRDELGVQKENDGDEHEDGSFKHPLTSHDREEVLRRVLFQEA